jgi:type I restriction enzyme, S subunit
MINNQNVPKLRFKEFSGEWNTKKLNEVTTYVDYRGKSPQKSESGIFLVTAKNIKKGFIDYESSKEYVLEEDYQEIMKRGKPQIGDVLLTTEAPLGNVAQIDNENIALAQRVIKFSGKENLDNTFLKHYFLSDKFQNLLESKAIGTTVLGIQGKVLHQLPLQIPEKLEQQKIASFLSAVDTKIDQLTRKKELLELYKKGMMQKIFSQELRFKANDGSEFTEWEEKRLGEIATFFKGSGISKDNISENGNLECIRYGELYTYYKETIHEAISKTNLDKNGLVLSQKNDIIIPSSGETAIDLATASCVLKDGIALGGDLNIIRTQQNGVFLSYYLNNAKKIEIASLAQGSSVIHLYSTHLKVLKLQLPSFLEQTKIANFLSAIDTKIDFVAKQLDEAKNFKKGLLQQMFV